MILNKEDIIPLDKDKIRSLASQLQSLVIWRGCQAGGKFDEYYDTAEYELFSDEWEMFHIKVTRKRDDKVILNAAIGETWRGSEYDYHALLRAIKNHKELLPLMKNNL